MQDVQYSVGVDCLKTTILLVEDSRFLRAASERALLKGGYEVICASDGEAAVRTAQERAPNLILLDMMLPKLDGLGVLRALKHNPQTAGIPVIVLTGLGQQNESKLKKEGAAAFFTKSDSLLAINSDTLLHVVESVLGKQETEAPSAEFSVPSELPIP
jgi:CheY-like chemotaxis protein